MREIFAVSLTLKQFRSGNNSKRNPEKNFLQLAPVPLLITYFVDVFVCLFFSFISPLVSREWGEHFLVVVGGARRGGTVHLFSKFSSGGVLGGQYFSPVARPSRARALRWPDHRGWLPIGWTAGLDLR